MTGRAYFEKYQSRAKKIAKALTEFDTGEKAEIGESLNDLSQMIRSILDDMIIEMQQIGEQRRVSTVAALDSIAEDMNRRWNKMSELFNKEFGDPLVAKDGFSTYYRKHFRSAIEKDDGEG